MCQRIINLFGGPLNWVSIWRTSASASLRRISPPCVGKCPRNGQSSKPTTCQLATLVGAVLDVDTRVRVSRRLHADARLCGEPCGRHDPIREELAAGVVLRSGSPLSGGKADNSKRVTGARTHTANICRYDPR
jgi:hypothetical protein